MLRTTHGTGSQRKSNGYTVRLAMVAAVGVTIAMPSLSAAQGPPETPVAAFHELPLLLNLGDRITVTDDTGRELQGELIDLSPSALSVLVDERHDLQETDSAGKTWCPNGWRCIAHTRYDLQETDIAGITQRHPDSLKDGALRGFMSGAAIMSVLLLSWEYRFHPAAGAGYRLLWRHRGSRRRGRG